MTKKLKKILPILILLGLVYYLQHSNFLSSETEQANSTQSNHPQDTAHSTVERYFKQKVSGKMIKLTAEVTRILSDDTHEPRHQRFVIELDKGLTVLISHNIDLAPRVSGLNIGDEVTITGQYEWNERGGVIHWTHHDPQGRRDGGQIIHQGSVYR